MSVLWLQNVSSGDVLAVRHDGVLLGKYRPCEEGRYTAFVYKPASGVFSMLEGSYPLKEVEVAILKSAANNGLAPILEGAGWLVVADNQGVKLFEWCRTTEEIIGFHNRLGKGRIVAICHGMPMKAKVTIKILPVSA